MGFHGPIEPDQAARWMGTEVGRLRWELRISQLQLADEAGVRASVVQQAEKGRDCRISTWAKLFDGLGYRLYFELFETCEEAEDLIKEEARRRKDRQLAGLFGLKMPPKDWWL